MNQNSTLADGGRDLPSQNEGAKFEDEATSGGGALGGVIAGAAVGCSYGAGGAIGGAIIDAILGDVFEESAKSGIGRAE